MGEGRREGREKRREGRIERRGPIQMEIDGGRRKKRERIMMAEIDRSSHTQSFLNLDRSNGSPGYGMEAILKSE